MEFNQKLEYYQKAVQSYLENSIPASHKYIGTILDSMRYSLFAGGKRIRPMLMLGVGEIFDCPADDILPFAAGMEMIHTYSLIHDDLPAMDNDDFRRGKPTSHKVYGEGMAVLTGDALLNYAFESMLKFSVQKEDIKFTQAVYEIAKASGIFGMIGGQVVDIENENKNIDKETMEFMHSNKTGALINASVTAGGIISGAGEDDLKRLSDFASDVGLAFQVIDDILDVAGDEKKMGKMKGSDEKKHKSTYVSMYGVEKSREIAGKLTHSAINHILYYNNKAEFLYNLTQYLLVRDY